MSDYIVSARKYRPDSFESLIGQDNIAQTLKNSIIRGKLAHAYLFCGPRGVGKTTTARIFAKAINCSNPSPDMEPCGECESCRSFQEGRSYCIHELDAASNNGVDDIKNLMGQVQIPPQVGKYSVYIIDEVHMLSTAAFNAFLKTLEEPPPRTLFLLLTDQPEQLLPTVISRCQRIDLPDARARALEEPYRSEVLSILAGERLAGVTAKAAAAGRLNAVLDKLRTRAEALVSDEVEKEEGGPGEGAAKEVFEARVAACYKDFRRDFTVTLMSWFRDLMALVAAPPSHSGYEDGDGGAPLVNVARRSVLESRAARLSLAAAMRNVEAVEAFAVSIDDRNIGEPAALAFLMDRLQFGVEKAP